MQKGQEMGGWVSEAEGSMSGRSKEGCIYFRSSGKRICQVLRSQWPVSWFLLSPQSEKESGEIQVGGECVVPRGLAETCF